MSRRVFEGDDDGHISFLRLSMTKGDITHS